VSAAATVLALTAVTFDIAVLELLMPLTVGATIALAPTGVARDERALAELLDDVTPDLIQATPSGWRFLLGAGSDAALAAAKTFPGNRPSSAIVLETLDPQTLGALIAFYEQRTFTAAVLLGINPFDQWGVELGKEMARAALDGSAGAGFDASSRALLARVL